MLKLLMPTRFEAQLKHAQHFARIAKELATAWKKDLFRDARLLQKFDREQPQLDRAWNVVIACPDLPKIDELRISMAEAAEPFLDFRYRPRDLLPRFETGVMAAKRLNQAAMAMRINGYLGQVHRLLGNIEIALELHQLQLEYAQSRDSTALFSGAFLNLGQDYLTQGNYAQAQTLFRQALQINHALNNRMSERAALSGLGVCALRQRHLQEAYRFFEQALQISRELGDRLGAAKDLGNLGVAAYQANKVHQALTYLQQHLSIIQEQGSKRAEAIALANLGLIESALGKWDEAINCHRRSLAIFVEMDDKLSMSRQYFNIAGLLGAQGQFVEALAMMEQSVSIKRDTGVLDFEADQAALSRMRSWLAKDGYSWQMWMWKWIWNGRAFYNRIRVGSLQLQENDHKFNTDE